MRHLHRYYFRNLLLLLFVSKVPFGWSQLKLSVSSAFRQSESLKTQENANKLFGRNASRINSYRTTLAKLQLLRRAVQNNSFERWFFINRFYSQEVKFLVSRGWANGVVRRKKTTSRLEDIILRSLNGENIDIAVMGGSISAGGGLSLDKGDFGELYYRLFADWWQKTVQPFTGSSVVLHNLAVGGTSSNFFAFCYKNLLGSDTDMDIAFLDFTVNDYIQFNNSKFPMAMPLEQLTREVLSERNSPSLIYVNFVQGLAKRPVCNNLENHGQTALAKTYGITSVSLRNFFCSSVSHSGIAFTKMFSPDGTHASALAHARIASMIINYVRETMLKFLDRLAIPARLFEKPLLPSGDASSVLSPCFRISQHNLPPAVFERNKIEFYDYPLCFTHITPDGTESKPLHQTLQVEEMGNFGFQFIKKQFINQPKKETNRDTTRAFTPCMSRTDAYGGWRAKSSNSILELAVSIPKAQFPSISKKCSVDNKYTSERNVAIAVRTHGHGGIARVWLDEYEGKGVSINTRSPFGHTRLHTIAWKVPPGRHVLSVRTITKGMFILSGVMTGPSYK